MKAFLLLPVLISAALPALASVDRYVEGQNVVFWDQTDDRFESGTITDVNRRHWWGGNDEIFVRTPSGVVTKLDGEELDSVYLQTCIGDSSAPVCTGDVTYVYSNDEVTMRAMVGFAEVNSRIVFRDGENSDGSARYRSGLATVQCVEGLCLGDRVQVLSEEWTMPAELLGSFATGQGARYYVRLQDGGFRIIGGSSRLYSKIVESPLQVGESVYISGQLTRVEGVTERGVVFEREGFYMYAHVRLVARLTGCNSRGLCAGDQVIDMATLESLTVSGVQSELGEDRVDFYIDLGTPNDLHGRWVTRNEIDSYARTTGCTSTQAICVGNAVVVIQGGLRATVVGQTSGGEVVIEFATADGTARSVFTENELRLAP